MVGPAVTIILTLAWECCYGTWLRSFLAHKIPTFIELTPYLCLAPGEPPLTSLVTTVLGDGDYISPLCIFFLTDCRHELNNSVSCLPGSIIPSCLHEFRAMSCILYASLGHRFFSCVMKHGSAQKWLLSFSLSPGLIC